MSRRQARIIAFKTIYRYDFTGESLERLMDLSWLGERKLKQLGEKEPEVLQFAQWIITGTIQNLDEIDRKITTFLEHWDFARVARVDRAILRFSVFSLLHMLDIPASVTINEAVEIAREFGSPDSYRFINGVLDGVRKSLPRV